ncbi:uncharacterized protein AtWU_02223 [Aspergillus tubingensis]|uniref:uncharacterized protein n=1 Tax=Aspergillus tubingensis TaxID=5068 RepID=UPI001578120E|nr:uncharacterized protein AtWU_02223 [Aspergillus tubingensis]GFN12426.1 hypothetical protein AtWU_02223 [Aspergillus tubingensis]
MTGKGMIVTSRQATNAASPLLSSLSAAPLAAQSCPKISPSPRRRPQPNNVAATPKNVGPGPQANRELHHAICSVRIHPLADPPSTPSLDDPCRGAQLVPKEEAMAVIRPGDRVYLSLTQCFAHSATALPSSRLGPTGPLRRT